MLQFVKIQAGEASGSGIGEENTIGESLLPESRSNFKRTRSVAGEHSDAVTESKFSDSGAMSPSPQPNTMHEEPGQDFATVATTGCFESVHTTAAPSISGGEYFNDSMDAYTLSSIKPQEASFVERPFGSTLRNPFSWYAGLPTWRCCGSCHQTNLQHKPSLPTMYGSRQNTGNYYSIDSGHGTGIEYGRLGETSYVGAHCSPAPTLSDCATASDVSNASFSSSYQDEIRHASSDHYQDWFRSNPKDYRAYMPLGSPSRSTPTIAQGVQSASQDCGRPWACQMGMTGHCCRTSDPWPPSNDARDTSFPFGSSYANSFRQLPWPGPGAVPEWDRLPNYESDSQFHAVMPCNMSSWVAPGILDNSKTADESQTEQDRTDNAKGARHSHGRGVPKRAGMHRGARTRHNHQRTAGKDDFLVRSRRAGMSYKEIKELGGFGEAESTLRGRFRNLTKSKDKRVRQPAWTDTDVALLKDAVSRLGRVEVVRVGARRRSRGAAGGRANDAALPRETETRTFKVSWVGVAEYISRHGGSYAFGVATCRKKWDEVKSKDNNA